MHQHPDDTAGEAFAAEPGRPKDGRPSPAPLLTVSAAEAGQKLVQYLGRVLGKDVPGSVFMRWIRTGQVRVDGKRAKPFDRVEEGQAVRLPPFALAEKGFADAPARASGEVPPVSAPEREFFIPGIAVLAVTDRWLVLEKPAGLPVHPGSGWTDSVQTRLGKAFAGEPFVPVIAHRLDRDTSGVLLVARTHRALTFAHEAFRQSLAAKEYLCWVRGRWTLSALHETIEMADTLAKSGAPGRERVRASRDEGKAARLDATPLLIEDARALLCVRLYTGRTHQIRAQLSSRGHPIAGDAKYGGGAPPMLLHAFRLTLDGETFTSLPPWTGQWAVPASALRP